MPDCVICYENIKKKRKKSPLCKCNLVYHKKCYNDMVKYNKIYCGYCKIVPDNVHDDYPQVYHDNNHNNYNYENDDNFLGLYFLDKTQEILEKIPYALLAFIIHLILSTMFVILYIFPKFVSYTIEDALRSKYASLISIYCNMMYFYAIGLLTFNYFFIY